MSRIQGKHSSGFAVFGGKQLQSQSTTLRAKYHQQIARIAIVRPREEPERTELWADTENGVDEIELRAHIIGADSTAAIRRVQQTRQDRSVLREGSERGGTTAE